VTLWQLRYAASTQLTRPFPGLVRSFRARSRSTSPFLGLVHSTRALFRSPLAPSRPAARVHNDFTGRFSLTATKSSALGNAFMPFRKKALKNAAPGFSTRTALNLYSFFEPVFVSSYAVPIPSELASTSHAHSIPPAPSCPASMSRVRSVLISSRSVPAGHAPYAFTSAWAGLAPMPSHPLGRPCF